MFVEEKNKDGYYKNKLEYPVKPPKRCIKCKTIIYETWRVCPICETKLNYPSLLIDYRIELEKYNNETKRLNEMFKIDLFEEYGIENYPKKEKVFEYAWDRGHSSGFSEVEIYFEELVQLLPDEV